jgi:hypothetical protein
MQFETFLHGMRHPDGPRFTSGPRDLPGNGCTLGDLSLRLNNGYAQDDALNGSR